MQRGRVAYPSILFCISAVLGACSANPDPVGDTVNTGAAAGAGGKSGNQGGTPNIGANPTGGGPDISVGGTDSNPVGIAEALSFDPPAITLVIDGAAAVKTAEYTLNATFMGGSKAKVSAESLQF